jgi:hypothetical protein
MATTTAANSACAGNARAIVTARAATILFMTFSHWLNAWTGAGLSQARISFVTADVASIFSRAPP